MSEIAHQIAVGPEDAGRRMSFEEFQRAEPLTGHRYELARGVVEVTDIPNLPHGQVERAIWRALMRYEDTRQQNFPYISAGSSAKLELPELASERHPDISIYLTEAPADDYPWDKWAPDIVIEVVSPGPAARKRDYVTKREEYLAAGVREYWIVDSQERVIVQLNRHGDRWNELRFVAGQHLSSPRLAEFSLDVGAVFAVLD